MILHVNIEGINKRCLQLKDGSVVSKGSVKILMLRAPYPVCGTQALGCSQ